ncbi:hypothetical protein LTR35_017781 [Friedmanniomyces endolithicus]|uniref:Uncharacterized protein n=1 Tax=Friedmanniomyces endolithicus TaxID=329885 RepID=A0AAN6F7U2_9PEZI|nr:hypothetical protein LTR35_017781 [Friedmanniomyces endolithicus]KAK0268278.1 hypothetical protein LTS00_017610 [Friedmanniomyces endolithicus]KAK0303430.1 hypothetical protein LTR82_017553 [Friedmanniomyces endolithicus]KAK0971589.1 hypothetical protein LTR54_017765 [Friedmanniomyces endolithicus]
MLSERRGRIKKARTVQTYWNTLSLVRQLEAGCFDVEPAVQVEMCGVRPSSPHLQRIDGIMPSLTGSQARQNLIVEFNITTAKEEKPIMRADDEFDLLKTLWESLDMGLQHDRLRVQLALMIQLAGITGNRPRALRRPQYKDLKIALQPDAAGGDRPRLVMKFTFERTKRYLGAKDSNTFPVPDIPREPCLLLCPQTMLLGLLFAGDAVAVPALKPKELFDLRIPAGKREMVILTARSKAELPLFRRVEHTTYGLTVAFEVVTENWLHERLQLLGQITGVDASVKP